MRVGGLDQVYVLIVREGHHSTSRPCEHLGLLRRQNVWREHHQYYLLYMVIEFAVHAYKSASVCFKVHFNECRHGFSSQAAS